MNDQNNTRTPPEDTEFHIVFGWLTALAVSIAGWAAGLS